MDIEIQLNTFKRAADRLDKRLFTEKQLEVATGIHQDSVFLKLYKKSWANPQQDPLTAETRIFFSVWASDSEIKEQKILYNIHAFKLRKLKNHAIESRKFADAFRANFKKIEHKWPNVSVKFGPLTLMQGWVKIDSESFQDEIIALANNFLEIEHLIDNTLAKFKR